MKFDPRLTYSSEDLSDLVASAKSRHEIMGPHNLGDGKASQKIVEDLLSRLRGDDFRGHSPNEDRRHIERNSGVGVGNKGQA